MASANLQAKVQQLNSKMEGHATMVIDNMEKSLLRPKAKQSYECVVKCYDKAGSTASAESLQHCSQQCQVAFHRAQGALQEVCVVVCLYFCSYMCFLFFYVKQSNINATKLL